MVASWSVDALGAGERRVAVSGQFDVSTEEAFVRDVLAASDGRSVLLITHRPEGLDLVDEVVQLPERQEHVHPGEAPARPVTRESRVK